MMIWSDFEFVIHLACIIKTRILDIIWPCILIIMIMTWPFSGILFICALVVSFAANDTTRAQINNIPSKSHVIPLLLSIRAAKWLIALCKTRHFAGQTGDARAEDSFATLILIGCRDVKQLRLANAILRIPFQSWLEFVLAHFVVL